MTASLEQIKAQLALLIEQAKSGAIVPIRLPGQLEALQELLNDIGMGQDAAPAAAPETPTDAQALKDEILGEQATFISHAIHELRTPMTSIRGYADMMNGMGELNPMQQQFVDTIRTNARRMEGLLTDVSDISKVRGGTLRVGAKMDMFKNIAMMVERQMQPVAEQLSRTLKIDLPQGLPLLNIDGELLAKALSKLVENALRYCEDNCEVTITAEAKEGDLVIYIKDNGIGMSEQELAQLGTLYFRSDNDVVRAYKGSGLGIPVAYGILKELGGTVQVSSTVGEGTTFTIMIAGMK